MKLKCRRFVPSQQVWKVKDDKTLQEFADLAYAVVEEKGQEYSNINMILIFLVIQIINQFPHFHWEFMKGIMFNAAEKVCGSTKGRERQINVVMEQEKVLALVNEKNHLFQIWLKNRIHDSWKKYH